MRVRDDDVILANQDELRKFMSVHDKIRSYGATHVAAVLVNFGESKWWSGAYKYILGLHQAGDVELQLHGWDHVDYAKLTKEEVFEHLDSATKWLRGIGASPTIWYTPWGANTPNLQLAAREFGMKLVDCSNIHQTHKILPALRSRHREDYIRMYRAHGEVMIHYWESRSTNALDEVLTSLCEVSHAN